MLFPDCDFTFSVNEPALYLGRRISGQLEVTAKEDIARAEVVFITYTVDATAEWGHGKQRRVVRRQLSRMVVRHELASTGLPAGRHAFAFVIDPPAGLPPSFDGNRCRVDHKLEARVDVDWARDPVGAVHLNVTAPPVVATRTPFSVRTPPSFHSEIALEITLASGVIAEGEPIHGQIALRGGQNLDAVVIEALRVTRQSPVPERLSTIAIASAALRGGNSVSFVVPPDPRIVPSFVGDPVSNELHLQLSADIPWAVDPTMTFAVQVVPRGSQLHGGGELAPVGAARVQLSARVMAQRTGVPEGRAPVLVEGAIGPVWLRVFDAPNGAQMGVRVDLGFPDTEMGVEFGPRGWFGDPSPALSPPLAARYQVSVEPAPHAPQLPPGVADGFVRELASGLEAASTVHVGDDHVVAHFTLADDDGARMATLASFLREKAERIGRALEALPPAAWMTPASVDAWRAAALEARAFLVPSVPKLSRVPVSARLFGGVDVTIFGTLGVVYEAAGPRTVVEVDLSGAPLPPSVDQASVVGGSEAIMTSIRSSFPEVSVSGTRATLARPGAAEDPRPLLGALGELLSWVIEVRGLRRETAAPYR